MMSEYLIASTPEDLDWRGDIHNNEGIHRFHTIQTPNSSAPDRMPGNWFVDNGDPAMPAVGEETGKQQNAARSRHSGGVNALHCDGSVAFYVDGVSTSVWQALGTMNGAEKGN
jgi:prepilin-type processing-associated H-X9-DG protein